MNTFLATLKTKTSIAAIVGVVGAGLGLWGGYVTTDQFVEALWAAVMVIFLRHGVEKSGPQSPA